MSRRISTFLSCGLVMLALRRSVGWTIPAVAAALVPILPALDRAAGTIPAGTADPLVTRGLARERGWTLALLVLVPLLLARVASRAAPWRRRDSAWLAARAPTNLGIFGASLAGASLAALSLALLVPVLVEATIPGSGAASPRAVATLAGPGTAWIDARTPCAWKAEWPGAGSGSAALHARLELLLGAGSGARAQCVLRVSSPAGVHESRATIGNRGAIEVELPAAAGPLAFEASVADAETQVLVSSPTITVWRADRPDWDASLHLATRLALAAVAWIAVALALSTWVSAASAVLGTLALWCLVWWNEGAASWCPGSDWFTALGTAALGRVPEPCPIGHGLATLGIAVVAIVLGRAGLRSWRRER